MPKPKAERKIDKMQFDIRKAGYSKIQRKLYNQYLYALKYIISEQQVKVLRDIVKKRVGERKNRNKYS